MDQPRITLKNGIAVPALGGMNRGRPEPTQPAEEAARGCHLIDTAADYDHERQVGQAIARSGLPRSEVFVTTKLWPIARRAEN